MHQSASVSSPNSIQILKNETKHHERWTHALLGQKILKNHSVIKHNNVELYLDADSFKLPSDWCDLELQIDNLKKQLSDHLPKDFNSWEDDDYVFDDEEFLVEESYWRDCTLLKTLASERSIANNRKFVSLVNLCKIINAVRNLPSSISVPHLSTNRN